MDRPLFLAACTKVQGAIVVTLTWSLVLAWALHCKVLRYFFFLCDGQGSVRQAILYADIRAVTIYCFIGISQYLSNKYCKNQNNIYHNSLHNENTLHLLAK